MRIFPACCTVIALSLGVGVNVLSQRASHHPAQGVQSEDVSLLKPEHVAYAEAMEFARFLNDKNIAVKSVHQSTLEGFFRGVEKAAFFRTDQGVVEVIFFPAAKGVEEIRVKEERRGKGYLYSFEGQPQPNPPGDTINSSRRIYFLAHRNWFIVLHGEEFYDALKRALPSSQKQ